MTLTLAAGNNDIAEYFLSRDDFLLSDLMPRPILFPLEIYDGFVARVIPRVNESIEQLGVAYARRIANDIEKILTPSVGDVKKPTKKDAEVLEQVARKISSMDWVADAQVLSEDFGFFGIGR